MVYQYSPYRMAETAVFYGTERASSRPARSVVINYYSVCYGLSWTTTDSAVRLVLGCWGYSPLEQIDRENVGDLRMVWTRGLASGSQQGTPLAYDGVLYMPNPNDVIQAIDAVTGGPPLGVSPKPPRGHRRVHPRSRQRQPKRGHLPQPHHRHEQRRFHLRASTPPPANLPGKPRSSTTRRIRPDIPPARLSPVARRSRDGVVGRGRGQRRVSSSHTTLRLAPNCGGGGWSRHRASRVTRRGETYPTRNGSMSGPGWRRVSIRN